MEPIRGENPDDRVIIRKETDAFLSGVVTNNYAQLRDDSITQVLVESGAFFTAGLPEFDSGEDGIRRTNPYLTGASSAILPMRFSISDRNNNKLTFTMLINPSNINHGKTATINNSYTRSGYISQVWGPNQDLITSTGKTAAFMVERIGLTNVARRRSFSYLNFIALLYAYRNNGYQFLDLSSFKDTLTRVINVIHGVELSYDNNFFMGHFNNFTIDESADRPYSFDYNFEFVISSLSKTYNEVRGHFSPIEEPGADTNPPRLVSEVNEDSEIRTPGTVGLGGF